jgi:hypothetical protein
MHTANGIDLENLLIGLAWLGEASTEHIRRLWMPDRDETTIRRQLRVLLQDDYLERRYWYRPRPDANGKRQGPSRQPALWSLAPKGRATVRELDTYPPASIAPRHRRLLPHDTQTYELIVTMIELARPAGLSGVYMEREVKLDPPRRRPIMDALISFRFGGGSLAENVVPWTKDPNDRAEIRRRYAVENDRSSEPLSVIKAKCDAYLAAQHTKWFQKYQKPFPLVLWVVPSETRLQSILRAWQEVWPEGRWLMTTDAWLPHNRWLYFSRGKITERPLYQTAEQNPHADDGVLVEDTQ